MNIIMNHINGFNIVVSHPVDPTRPEYNTKFAVSITPSRIVGNFNGKFVRAKEDVFYIDSWDTAIHYYRDLVKYAEKNVVQG
jgi:hypothetical protein